MIYWKEEEETTSWLANLRLEKRLTLSFNPYIVPNIWKFEGDSGKVSKVKHGQNASEIVSKIIDIIDCCCFWHLDFSILFTDSSYVFDKQSWTCVV